MSRLQELDIPVPAEADRASEVARLWITPADGRCHVMLNWGRFGADEVRIWGSLAAEIMVHAVQAALLENPVANPAALLALAEAGMRDRLADEPDVDGEFKPASVQ